MGISTRLSKVLAFCEGHTDTASDVSDFLGRQESLYLLYCVVKDDKIRTRGIAFYILADLSESQLLYSSKQS